MKRNLLLAAFALPIACFAQTYTTNGVVYATSGGTSSTAASTSPGQLLIGTGSSPTWASTLPFSLIVNHNAATAPGLQGLSGQISGEFAAADTTQNYVFLDSFGARDILVFRQAANTNTSPQAMAADANLGQIAWYGYNGTSYVQTAYITAETWSAWSSTDNSSRFNFFTTVAGTTTPTRKMSLFGSGGLALGSSIANADPGAGNLAVVGSVSSASLFVSGIVGIGTTDQTYPLSVNGTIEAKEVLVQTGWSDYIFAKDYHLEPLAEIESFVRLKHHLPGIPSAKEVAEKGVNLGEMQSKLLAQIEQLTLHLIEQEKRLNEQSDLLRIQSGQIETLQMENAFLNAGKTHTR